jgi:hypothetical protein
MEPMMKFSITRTENDVLKFNVTWPSPKEKVNEFFGKDNTEKYIEHLCKTKNLSSCNVEELFENLVAIASKYTSVLCFFKTIKTIDPLCTHVVDKCMKEFLIHKRASNDFRPLILQPKDVLHPDTFDEINNNNIHLSASMKFSIRLLMNHFIHHMNK